MGRKEKEKQKNREKGGGGQSERTDPAVRPALSEQDFNKVFKWILMGSFALLVIFLSTFRVTNLDMGVHLKTGKMVLETGHIPNTNIYSYTMTHRPYTDHEWGFQAFAALVYYTIGPNGLILLRILLIGGSFILLVLMAYEKSHPAVLFMIAGFAVISSSLRFYIRPEAFSLFFMSVFLFILMKYRRTKNWKILIILPIVQLFWVNMHGFFIFGLMFILFFILSELILNWLPEMAGEDPELSKPEELLPVLAVLGATFLACFINPYFIEGALYPLAALGALAEIFQKKISELKSPFKVCAHVTFKGIFFFKILLYVGIPMMLFTIRGLKFRARATVSLAALALIIYASEFRTVSIFGGDTQADKNWALFTVLAPLIAGYFLRVQPYYLALFSLFAFMAYRFNRNIGFFAFLCVPLLPPIISQFVRELRKEVEEYNKDWKPLARMAAMAGTVAVVIFLLYFVQMVATNEFYYSERSTKRFGLGLSRLAYPTKAVEFVKKNKIHELPGNMYNNFDTGNFLIWQIYPNKRVFIDGRTEVYGEFYEHVYYNLMAAGMNPGASREEQIIDSLWHEKMQEYNVNFIIYKHSSNDVGNLPRRVHMSGSLNKEQTNMRFILVYFDQTAAVYLRDIPQNRRIIEQNKPNYNNPPVMPEIQTAGNTEKAFFHNYIGRFLIHINRAPEALNQFKQAKEYRELEDFYNGLGAAEYPLLRRRGPNVRKFDQLRQQLRNINITLQQEMQKPPGKRDNNRIERLKSAGRNVHAQARSLHNKAFEDVKPALMHMKKATDINPGYFEAYRNMSRIYQDFGIYGKANELMRKFVEMNYGLEPEQRNGILNQLDRMERDLQRQKGPQRFGGRMPRVQGRAREFFELDEYQRMKR